MIYKHSLPLQRSEHKVQINIHDQFISHAEKLAHDVISGKQSPVVKCHFFFVTKVNLLIYD